MSAVVLAMLSAISGGFANLFARRLVTVSQARHMLSLNFALMTVMLLPAAPWLFQLHINAASLLILVGAIGLDGLANYGYFRSFERLDAVSVSGILAVSPLFALILSPVFLYQGEYLGLKQIAAVLFFYKWSFNDYPWISSGNYITKQVTNKRSHFSSRDSLFFQPQYVSGQGLVFWKLSQSLYLLPDSSRSHQCYFVGYYETQFKLGKPQQSCSDRRKTGLCDRSVAFPAVCVKKRSSCDG